MKKFVFTLLLVTFVAACSSSVQPKEINECRELAYGGTSTQIANMDVLYDTCLEKKKAEQERQDEEKRTFQLFEIILDLFFD